MHSSSSCPIDHIDCLFSDMYVSPGKLHRAWGDSVCVWLCVWVCVRQSPRPLFLSPNTHTHTHTHTHRWHRHQSAFGRLFGCVPASHTGRAPCNRILAANLVRQMGHYRRCTCSPGAALLSCSTHPLHWGRRGEGLSGGGDIEKGERDEELLMLALQERWSYYTPGPYTYYVCKVYMPN